MEATHANSADIQSRLSEMKLRISSKKTTADMLFSGIHEASANNSQKPLESILESLKKQQNEEGNTDSTFH